MKIGIIGVGHIGKTLALKLAAAGHDVSVAKSKSPEEIQRVPGQLLKSKRLRRVT
jgi:predicted dinucleotide-binding enzyme